MENRLLDRNSPGFCVVYPGGDRRRLGVAAIGSLSERGDVLAAAVVRDTAEEAHRDSISLAREHGLEVRVDPRVARIEMPHPPEGPVWIVIFPRGELDRISVAEAMWFDVPDYRLVSAEWHVEEEQAQRAAAEIAAEWELPLECDAPDASP